ncbi:MAG: stage 0 sporulation family protein [Nitrospirae bacterium]|nr:stage 0 sporulation family protein [Nitrospirota bacterium]
MPDVVGIRFKSCGKIYDFEVDGLDLRKGDSVVVESELGLSIGNVIIEKHPFVNAPKELKKVLRRAVEEDLRQKKENEGLEADARTYCLERIMARGLPMKLICTEVTLDRKRIIFYFAAEGRIDFRELVKDLAAKFKTRIEMRQIGVRDEAKMLGGLGICGRELCCKKFLTTFEPISIKMAKSQELVLNANKLSGVCGRLMCCLSYEYNEGEEAYRQEESVRTRTVEGGGPAEASEKPHLSISGEGPAGPANHGKKEGPEHASFSRAPGVPEKGEAAEVKQESKEGTSGALPAGAAPEEKKFHRRRRRRRKRHQR